MYCFLRSQEEHSKLKVRHNRMHVLHMLTVWLAECLAGRGQQIADAGDRQLNVGDRSAEIGQISGSHPENHGDSQTLMSLSVVLTRLIMMFLHCIRRVTSASAVIWTTYTIIIYWIFLIKGKVPALAVALLTQVKTHVQKCFTISKSQLIAMS